MAEIPNEKKAAPAIDQIDTFNESYILEEPKSKPLTIEFSSIKPLDEQPNLFKNTLNLGNELT